MSEKSAQAHEITCGNCKGSTWKLCIANLNGKDLLCITCASEQCLEKVSQELQSDNDDSSVIWMSFDITGQMENTVSMIVPVEGEKTSGGLPN